MNETEIRDRVHGALGDSSYPPDLPRRVTVGLDSPPRRDRSAMFGVVAALLALLIVGTLVFVRLQSSSTPLPGATPAASPSPQSTPIAALGIPQADLDRAQLSQSGDLVTPFNLSSTSSGRTVTLLGAYADAARTVLFLRTMPVGGFPHATISDDSGFLNAGSTEGRGIIGDSIFILNAGPHAGSDGLAHLRVVIDTFESIVQPAAQSQSGNWTFAFPLGVPASIHLLPAPPLTSVGSWRFTVEAFEVTASEVHFQAVIDGASLEDIKKGTFTMIGTKGTSLQLVTYEAGTTVPKSQITSIPPRNTRVNIAWRRPTSSDVYFLVVNGKYQGGVEIPGSIDSASVKKGTPLAPIDYPAATEAITFDGAFSTTVSTGYPNQCGHGTGPSGTLFAFGMWFQVDQAWYSILFSTDPRVRQYSGPGTYDIKAQIWPLGSSAIFDGTVRLTVTSDSWPGPETGSVRGTLTWTGAATQPYTVNVGGSWKCTPGGQLGPG